MPYILGAVFARGGSKRVPRKNLRLLAGRPLIAHAIDTARSSQLIDRVIVSTDDPEIRDVAIEYGADVPFIRPPELATDGASEWMAWQHALQAVTVERGTQPDVFVCVPTTSPLRTVDDLDRCIRELLASDADIVITVRQAESNPYYNMVKIDGDGYAKPVISSEEQVYRRDAYPEVFDMTTVAYVARPQFVLNSVNPFSGRVRACRIPAERSLDIDTELDFRFAEYMLTHPGRSE